MSHHETGRGPLSLGPVSGDSLSSIRMAKGRTAQQWRAAAGIRCGRELSSNMTHPTLACIRYRRQGSLDASLKIRELVGWSVEDHDSEL